MQTADVRFGFKETTKRTQDVLTGKMVPVLDENGKEIKIPAPKAVVLSIPQFSTAADLQAIVDSGDEKQIKLAVDALNDVVLGQAKMQIEDARQEDVDLWEGQEEDEKGVVTKAASGSFLDLSKLEWGYIANLPPAQRGQQGIPQEEWEAFAEDYKQVIIHHGKTPDKAEAAAKLYLKKFAPVRGHKKMLAALKDNLLLWAANTSNMDKYSKIYENLMSKLDTLLSADEDAIVAAV